MRLCITGSTGFVGQNLIHCFSDSGITFLPLVRQELISGNYDSLSNSNAIIHLAGKAHDLKNTSKPDEYYHVNFELTKKLYDAFLKSDAQKFIFISSVKAAADHLDEALTEAYTPNPETHYGKSKLMAEQYILSQPLPEGKSYYILRPCMIHGPGNKGNLNLLYQFVSKGLPYPLASFENKRSFLSVENLCFIIKEILERDGISSGIYHVADDEPLSTNTLIAILSEALNKSPHLWRVPAGLIKSLAKFGDKFKLPLNSERLGKLTENYVVSNQKIKEVLKKDLPLSSKEGIMRTAKSFSESLDENSLNQ